ncbi:hypothetical protein Q3W71_14330 [Micromonospora sp. C28SCA-DRY-2]|uniref:hypothetical protein n=1 Tax=Micromonospora sp. C28SCA-DRY-2 TaxID=3059522 RepID=UPI0026749600|nr:hypothetical protein [Micromonospora sp. C28SCA-DRY-2]MDO3702845.1 hypothetical protein [Micromonospora sp. C28SCA-DRY-2]
MGTLLAQVPALLGVLVGTLGTIFATSLADRARWRRNQSIRWDERRLDAYVEYAHAVKESHAIALRMTADRRPNSHSHPIDREAGLARLAEADARRTIAWENMLLLGDEATVAAAGVWRDAVWQLERLARGIADPEPDMVGVLSRVNEARDGFYRAARRSIAVRGGSVAQSALLEQALLDRAVAAEAGAVSLPSQKSR